MSSAKNKLCPPWNKHQTGRSDRRWLFHGSSARPWFGPRFAALSVAAFLAALAFGQTMDPGTVADIAERTAPFGKLCLEGQDCAGSQSDEVAAPVAALSGSDVYGRFCFTCHDAGLNDAPMVGDAEAWAPRLAKGNEVLLQNTKDGFNNGLMPAMGLCMSCSDAELEAAIDFMTSEADAP